MGGAVQGQRILHEQEDVADGLSLRQGLMQKNNCKPKLELETFAQFASDLDKVTQNQSAKRQWLRELLKQARSTHKSTNCGW